jgi:hypothetical protein
MRLKFFVSAAIAAAFMTSTVFAASPLFSINHIYDAESGYQIEDGSYSQALPDSDKYNVLYVNGNFAHDANIIIKNNRSLVPIRYISENFGYNVDWDAQNRKITITGSGKTITLTINSDTAYIDGNAVKLDASPEITNNLTYVPVRAIAECFGGTADYYSFDSSNSSYKVPSLAVIAVENANLDTKYSKEDAVNTVKNNVSNALKKNNCNPDGIIKGRYKLDVSYEADLGRYYVINVYSDTSDKTPYASRNKVLFDKTTGDMYSGFGGFSLILYHVTDGYEGSAGRGIYVM